VERSHNAFDSSALLQPAQAPDTLTETVQGASARVQTGRIVTKGGDDDDDSAIVGKGIDVVKY
jgi:hypothetical protein